MALDHLKTSIKQRAHELGFELCGIAPAEPSAFKAEFRAWLEKGYEGEMGYLSRTADLKPGQNVWTSGLGGIFPKDIFIGKIVDAHSEDFGMSTVAHVKLGANLSALEEVWVMMEP